MIDYVKGMDVRTNEPEQGQGTGASLVRPMPVPRRVYFGALLSGLVVAGLVTLGVLGAQLAPQSMDFRFTRGVELAPGEEARLRGHLADLASDPDRLIRIVGHTGVQGDADANLELSRSRAALAEAIARDVGVPASRLISIAGVGGGAPLAKEQGASDREWERGLSRVTISDQAAP